MTKEKSEGTAQYVLEAAAIYARLSRAGVDSDGLTLPERVGKLVQQRDKAQAERDAMYKLGTKMAARVNIVVNAMRAGADLNTLYDVIQTELAPLVEHEEAADE